MARVNVYFLFFDLRRSVKRSVDTGFCSVLMESGVWREHTSRLTRREWRSTIPTFMSALFFKRFLQRPFQIASIIPAQKPS